MNAIAAIPRSPQWHAIRRQGIGSSDAVIIAGVTPPSRGDPVQLLQRLYAEKIGLLDPEDAPDNPLMEWGRRLEDVVAVWYAERTGLKVRRDNKVRTHRDLPWMRASLDRLAVPGPRIVEVKTVPHPQGEQWGEDGTDEIPLHVLIQVQHQLAVTDLPVADVAALLHGYDARLYTIHRDEGLIMDLIALEGEFWECVAERREPDFQRLLAPERRPRPAAEDELTLPPEDPRHELIRQAWLSNLVRRQAEDEEKAAKERVTDGIKDYAFVRAEAVDVSYRQAKPTVKVQWDRVAAAYRKAYEGLWDHGVSDPDQPVDLDAIESIFTLEEAGSRRLLFIKHKE